ncbi:MAG: xylulokinase [Candidatus Planktophila sp.]|nr:xylulokinase [Candidatus Planktophila sp.]
MPIVAGVDSSTQSVKIVLRDAHTGELLASASRPHPDGTQVDPRYWWEALQSVINDVGGVEAFDAIGIAGQQHGMVVLDESGEVIRPALLWNDTRSSASADALNLEFPDIHKSTGSKLVASFTASKVRWVRENEAEHAEKVRAIALPHDWLSWKLSGSTSIKDLFTDRSDASGTGYFDSKSNTYVDEIVKASLGHNDVFLPRVVAANEFGFDDGKLKISAGAGDNAAGALGVGAKLGDLVISLGTSGTAFAITDTSTHDISGSVAGFADATGNFLPLACTLNAAKVFDSVTKILGISFDEFSKIALDAKPGAGGITFLPHFDGERTPNKPEARGNILGLTHKNFTAPNIARAAIEGVISGIAYAAHTFEDLGVSTERILLIGGASQNPAVQQIATEIFGRDIYLPPAGEYVADGAAKQAAWALLNTENPPAWGSRDFYVIPFSTNDPSVKKRYLEAINSL